MLQMPQWLGGYEECGILSEESWKLTAGCLWSGTYAALKKEFDMAEKMFTEAAHRGLADAEEMLKQIEEIKH